jgi:hypothetical protein
MPTEAAVFDWFFRYRPNGDVDAQWTLTSEGGGQPRSRPDAI